MYKSGYIGILGRPNVGKSTLLNAFIGEKLAAVTNKPQTTRHRILGIKTRPEGQLLFVDTPGLHTPHKSLNQYMMEVTESVLADVDLILFLVEPSNPIPREDRELLKKIQEKKKPIVLVINKVDKVSKDSLLGLIQAYHQGFQLPMIFPISAMSGVGLLDLENELLKLLPEGPVYFPEDQISDSSERFLASEIIRERATDLTKQEIPYALAVAIEAYEEPKEEDLKKVVRIRASIIIEKDSQKGILIGKQGSMIKRIGQEARLQIESRLGQKVFLELFVRVEPDWTKDPHKVKELAYS